MRTKTLKSPPPQVEKIKQVLRQEHGSVTSPIDTWKCNFPFWTTIKLADTGAHRKVTIQIIICKPFSSLSDRHVSLWCMKCICTIGVLIDRRGNIFFPYLSNNMCGYLYNMHNPQASARGVSCWKNYILAIVEKFHRIQFIFHPNFRSYGGFLIRFWWKTQRTVPLTIRFLSPLPLRVNMPKIKNILSYILDPAKFPCLREFAIRDGGQN